MVMLVDETEKDLIEFMDGFAVEWWRKDRVEGKCGVIKVGPRSPPIDVLMVGLYFKEILTF